MTFTYHSESPYVAATAHRYSFWFLYSSTSSRFSATSLSTRGFFQSQKAQLTPATPSTHHALLWFGFLTTNLCGYLCSDEAVKKRLQRCVPWLKYLLTSVSDSTESAMTVHYAWSWSMDQRCKNVVRLPLLTPWRVLQLMNYEMQSALLMLFPPNSAKSKAYWHSIKERPRRRKLQTLPDDIYQLVQLCGTMWINSLRLKLARMGFSPRARTLRNPARRINDIILNWGRQVDASETEKSPCKNKRIRLKMCL